MCVVFDFFQKKFFIFSSKKKLNFENPKQHLLVERSPPREGGRVGSGRSGRSRSGRLSKPGWSGVDVWVSPGGKRSRLLPRRVGGWNFAFFSPLQPQVSFFLPSLSGWRLKRWGLEMCMSGVLGLSCEAPVAPKAFTGGVDQVSSGPR